MNQKTIDVEEDMESNAQSFNREQFESVFAKILESAKHVLEEEVREKLISKLELYSQNKLALTQFIEHFVYTLISHIEQLNSSFNLYFWNYIVLQNSMQKSEAQIRKHIRIEQQLKIYMDGLEQKVEDLQKKLILEENKYMQLFETMREVDQQRKDLLKRIMCYEDRGVKPTQKQKERSKVNSNLSTIIPQQSYYNEYFVGKKVRGNSKSKQIIQKINERARRLQDKKKSSKVNFLDGAIHINLSNNIVVSKKSSFDNSQPQKIGPNHQSSIRELARTEIKQDKAVKRKLSKYKSEQSEVLQNEARSKSVFY